MQHTIQRIQYNASRKRVAMAGSRHCVGPDVWVYVLHLYLCFRGNRASWASQAPGERTVLRGPRAAWGPQVNWDPSVWSERRFVGGAG